MDVSVVPVVAAVPVVLEKHHLHHQVDLHLQLVVLEVLV